MDIFISYSSKYRDLCERLRLALDAEGHHCFVDRHELEPGQPFDAELREAVADCDVFIFLVSPESVAAGSYALAELNLRSNAGATHAVACCQWSSHRPRWRRSRPI